MPELELETVFEAGSPVISPDPSGSMEAEDDDDGCTNSIENGITTKCQIRNGNMRLSDAPLLVPPTLAEAKKSMTIIKVQTESQQHTTGWAKLQVPFFSQKKLGRFYQFFWFQ